ncbi:MAG: 1-hydroxycarotenoid 3,4-desaturase CrtD [Rhizobiaceae bacterium]
MLAGPPIGEKRVVIIGAGMGGLVGALLLAHAGLDVTVVEKEVRPGGKVRTVEAGGLAIDSGPTVLTMKPVFDAIFETVGARLADHVRLTPAGILARHEWPDGAMLDLFADHERTADAIGELAGPAEADGYRRFHARSAEVFRTLDRSFMQEAEPGIGRLIAHAGVAGLPALTRIQAFSTLWSVLGGYFRDKRLRQLFGRYATYCGSSPFAAPGPLMLVADAEQQGVWLARDGMTALPLALAQLARREGARFVFGQNVERVIVESGRAAGIELSGGERMPADIVLFNGDPAALGAGLLGAEAAGATEVWPARARSLSALTLSIAARAKGFPLLRHNVFFSGDYREEFEAIFARGQLPAEPTIYVCAQDRDDRGRKTRPGGRERLFMIANAPATGDGEGPTQREIEQCTMRIMQRLTRAGLDLEIDPGTMVATGPAAFHQLFPGTGGALYGRSSHGWMASFQRPTARSRIPGLYLAGGATHPGPGLPMAALSGRHAARTILRDCASTARFHKVAMPGGMSTR